MILSDFDYHLPKERIAQTPITPRDHSRLMTLDRDTQNVGHRHFFELIDLLDSDDVLVFNQSRVIPARIRVVLEGLDKEAEIFLLKSLSENRWECLVKPGKRFREGDRFQINTINHAGEDSDHRLQNKGLMIYIQSVKPTGERVIHFECEDLDSYIKAHGQMPVPPYIEEKLDDPERYQTVYSKSEGSVAAPTAGLHFTPELLEKLKKKGVQMEFVTLHVGLGTFQGVKTENITDHHMHSEFFQLDQSTSDRLNDAKKSGKRIISVGTTSVRVLESCSKNDLLRPHSGETDIFIYPGYKWQFVDGMITNFHLPKSTLLMLVSSFVSAKQSSLPVDQLLKGRDFILKAYQEAINREYRFFSFGDAMLIL